MILTALYIIVGLAIFSYCFSVLASLFNLEDPERDRREMLPPEWRWSLPE